MKGLRTVGKLFLNEHSQCFFQPCHEPSPIPFSPHPSLQCSCCWYGGSAGHVGPRSMPGCTLALRTVADERRHPQSCTVHCHQGTRADFAGPTHGRPACSMCLKTKAVSTQLYACSTSSGEALWPVGCQPARAPKQGGGDAVHGQLDRKRLCKPPSDTSDRPFHVSYLPEAQNSTHQRGNQEEHEMLHFQSNL